MNEKSESEVVKVFFYYYLNKYLLLLDNIEESLINIDGFLVLDEYIVSLETFIEIATINNEFPNKMYVNIGKILDHIGELLQNSKIFKNYDDYKKNYDICIHKLEKIKDNNNYKFYNDEFLKRIDNIYEYANNKAFIWNKEDLEDSIRFDYILLQLLIMNDKDYNNTMKGYILNNKVIYSLRSLLLDYPQILEDSVAKERINQILDYNIRLIEQNPIEKTNLCYKESNEISDDLVYEKEIEKLKNDSINLKEKINIINPKYIGMPIQIYSDFYHKIMYENILLSSETDFDRLRDIITNDYLNLDYLYKLISSNSAITNKSEKIKKRLIYIMDEFKEKYKINKNKKLLEQYNSFLTEIHKIKEDTSKYDWQQLIYKLELKDFLAIYFRAMILKSDEYEDIIGSVKMDMLMLEAFMCSDKEFSEEYKEKIINNEDYLLSLNRFIIESPYIFSDVNVYNRVTNIINSAILKYKNRELQSRDFYKQNKKMLKKLDKIYRDKK